MPALVKFTGYKSHAHGKGGMRAMGKHMKYIEADREREDGTKVHDQAPELFNEKGKIIRQEYMDLLKTQSEKGVIAHKAVISLSQDEADRQQINIKEWVKDAVSRLEAKNGRKFNWCAAVHQDKGHPHAHIVIAGRDTDGKEVYFRDRDIKNFQKIAEQEKEAQHTRNQIRGDRNPERDWLKELQQEQEHNMTRSHQRQKSYEFER